MNIFLIYGIKAGTICGKLGYALIYIYNMIIITQTFIKNINYLNLVCSLLTVCDNMTDAFKKNFI